MNLRILGAPTLQNFTDSIISGFSAEGVETQDQDSADFALIQIHGSPAARAEDQRILETSRLLKIPKVFLIHRPDEALIQRFIKAHFENDPRAKLIFLGDLIFKDPFWAKRREFSSVIPHPHLDLSMPLLNGRPIVGSFTSWGEMRDVKHYFALVECLKDANLFEFRIGGTGLDKVKFPDYVQHTKEPFAPHFNVQLYHLFGKKRYGESSGSLHRGISIPIIFEANGAERLEGFKAVKIAADDELRSIHFDKAAAEILKLVAEDIDPLLERNRKVAMKNSVQAFAKSILSFLVS